MYSKPIILILLIVSCISCDQYNEKVAKLVVENYDVRDRFIVTEKMKRLDEKTLNGLKPIKVESYPSQLDSSIINYVFEKYGEKTKHKYIVYYNTVIEYSPDTTGYLDTNHYSIDLELYNTNDTSEIYLQYTKDVVLDFDVAY